MSASSRWKVVAIVEDDSDGRALSALLRLAQPALRFDWLPALGIGNIASRTAALLQLARDRLGKEPGCVSIIVDGDGKDLERDEPHCTIARVCREQQIPLIICRETFEAWLLADPGCSTWLGIPAKGTTHGLRDAKRLVARAFFKKTKRTYQQRRARLEVAGRRSADL